MRYPKLVAILTAALFSLIAACAPQTEIVKLYEDSNGEPKAYEHLLIVDISSDPNRQIFFENEIVNQLNEKQVRAIAAHTSIDSSAGVEQDEIDALSARYETDAILITHIVSVDTKADIEQGREEVVSVCRQGDPLDYFLYDHTVLAEPNSAKLAHTVVVVSSLYDAESRERVWSIQSTCFDRSSMLDVLVDEASAIVRQLRIDERV